MLEESREQLLKDLNFVRHPTVSCILIKNGKYFCVKHPKPIGMNAGAMQQHLRGKAHNIDSKTSNPINKIDFLEIIKELQNKEQKKSEREEFDDFLHIMTKLCALKDRTQAIIIADHTLKGKNREIVLNQLCLLFVKDMEEAEAEKKKAEKERSDAEFEEMIADSEIARRIRNLSPN